jgi:glycine cleavage system H lipoate-binding protein
LSENDDDDDDDDDDDHDDDGTIGITTAAQSSLNHLHLATLTHRNPNTSLGHFMAM